MKSSNKTITDGYLADFKHSREALSIIKLSSSQNGTYFFNSYRGSKILPCNDVSFCIAETTFINITELKNRLAGTFVGCIRWLYEEREVGSAENTSFLREGMLFDNHGNIVITVWGDLII